MEADVSHHWRSLNKEFEKRLTELESKHEGQFEVVFNAIRELMSERAVPLKRIIGLGTDRNA